MQLAQIKYFLAACETTNFTHAAKACNVTQPALTRSIRMLEDELGGALFLREHHLTQLTPFGVLMRAHFEQILADTERLREAARQYKARHSTALNLGATSGIASQGFVDLLTQFGNANSCVQVNVFEDTQERLLERLLDGTLHLAVIADAGDEDDRFQSIRLFSERCLVAFARSHRFHDMTAIRLAELCREQLVALRDCRITMRLRQACLDRDIDLEDAMTSDGVGWALTLVAAGIGVMLVPETMALAPGLAAHPLADLRLERHVQLVAAAGRNPTPQIARFIRLAQSLVWSKATTTA
jgi:LysR family transcriptional regulator, hydrogen peroxide-inducible genes activator